MLLIAALVAPAMNMAVSSAWADLLCEQPPRLSAAESARSVLLTCSSGTLCSKLDGADSAFTTRAEYLIDDEGCPLVALPDSQASRNLEASGAATLFVSAAEGNSQAGSGVTLIGEAERVPIDSVTDAQLSALGARSGLSNQRLATYGWLRMTPTKVHYADSIYGSEVWVPHEEYGEAEPSVLTAEAPDLLAKLNNKHSSDLVRFAAVYCSMDEADVRACRVLSIDHLGFDLGVLRTSSGSSMRESDVIRIGLKVPPQTAEEATSAFTKLFQESYARQQGWM